MTSVKQNPNQPIILVDDDPDDLEVMCSALEELNLGLEIQCYRSGSELYDGLKKKENFPFLIICDMNIPGEEGLEIRQKLNADPDTKYSAIPFVYLSTSSSPYQVRKAYDLNIQGFFIKPSRFEDIKAMLARIVDYWEYCVHPK